MGYYHHQQVGDSRHSRYRKLLDTFKDFGKVADTGQSNMFRLAVNYIQQIYFSQIQPSIQLNDILLEINRKAGLFQTLFCGILEFFQRIFGMFVDDLGSVSKVFGGFNGTGTGCFLKGLGIFYQQFCKSPAGIIYIYKSNGCVVQYGFTSKQKLFHIIYYIQYMGVKTSPTIHT